MTKRAMPGPEWYMPPRVRVTRSYLAIDRNVLDEPWFADVHVVGAWLRALSEIGRVKRARQPRDYISRATRTEIIAAFGGRCAYCGRGDVALEIDHRIPVSKGGTSDRLNLVPACKPCNVRKFNHDPAGWPIVVAVS